MNTSNDNNKKYKIIILILIIIAVIGIGVSVFLILNDNTKDTGSGKGDSKPTPVETFVKTTKRQNVLTGEDEYVAPIDVDNLEIEYADDLAKKIKVEKMIYTEKEKLVILVKNETDVPVELDAEIHYLDADGIKVSKAIGWDRKVGAGREVSDEIGNASKEDFKQYKLVISAKKIKSYQYAVDPDSIVLEKTETESGINVKYTNNTADDASIYISFIYYKNNEIHHIESGTFYAKSGETDEVNSYFNLVPDYSNGDKYEIITSGAIFSKDY